MKISDILKKDFIIANLAARDKDSALKEISLFLEHKELIPDHQVLYQSLLEREKLGSTGIGDNMGIPHAKSENLDRITTVFARSKEGIEFDSLDRKPVHYIFLLLAPSASTGLHLKALARIARLFKSPTIRKSILEKDNPEEIYSIIINEDSKLK